MPEDSTIRSQRVQGRCVDGKVRVFRSHGSIPVEPNICLRYMYMHMYVVNIRNHKEERGQ